MDTKFNLRQTELAMEREQVEKEKAQRELDIHKYLVVE